MKRANLIDLFSRSIYETRYEIKSGRIYFLEKKAKVNKDLPYILPGFVDAHVHIESSMLTPPQFARLAVVHGSVGSVSDPHEIANVLGVKGVEFMLEEAKKVPFKFCFGAPSCVPATTFETAGAELTPDDIDYLLAKPEIGYLAEVMNFPGVLHQDPRLHAIIAHAKKHDKPIDGHAPGLRGELAQQYFSYGISTDHECFTYEEALDKINCGTKILIREGCAARNFDALITLFKEYPGYLMFCSDDKHPDQLSVGHINVLVKRALSLGYDLFDVLRAACVHPVEHYKLPIGQLKEGDLADFIEIDSLETFRILRTYINGEEVASNGVSHIPDYRSEHLNNFNCLPTSPSDFKVKSQPGKNHLKVIQAIDGELITRQITVPIKEDNGEIVRDLEEDILKIAVINRYNPAPVSVGFINGFKLKKGAIASSVAHDSHNIIVVGTDDESMSKAANYIIEHKGGMALTFDEQLHGIQLPIAGILTDEDGYQIGKQYATLVELAKDQLACPLRSPFMTLSFMALLVIPSIKLSDLGLFNTDQFNFTTMTD